MRGVFTYTCACDVVDDDVDDDDDDDECEDDDDMDIKSEWRDATSSMPFNSSGLLIVGFVVSVVARSFSLVRSVLSSVFVTPDMHS